MYTNLHTYNGCPIICSRRLMKNDFWRSFHEGIKDYLYTHRKLDVSHYEAEVEGMTNFGRSKTHYAWSDVVHVECWTHGIRRSWRPFNEVDSIDILFWLWLRITAVYESHAAVGPYMQISEDQRHNWHFVPAFFYSSHQNAVLLQKQLDVTQRSECYPISLTSKDVYHVFRPSNDAMRAGIV